MIELLWNAPISESKMDAQIAALEIQDSETVLDIGCGCGEVSLRICERYSADAVGIDSSVEHLAEARRRASSRRLLGQVTFTLCDAKDYRPVSDSLDVVLCLGATHAFGSGSQAFLNALRQIVSMVRPGGRILLSDGYAKQTISKGYREFIGDSLSSEDTHESRVQQGTSLGLIPLGAWTSSLDEWDHFEWSYQRVIEKHAQADGSDKDASARLQSRRQWMDAYLRWGRETLGYGTYLFLKPNAQPSIDGT